MVEEKNVNEEGSVLIVKPIKFSNCGHDLKTDLDVVCETCDKFFISKSLLFLISFIIFLLMFLKKISLFGYEIISFGDYENSFILYFLGFWLFIQISILRNRKKELFISFAILIPTLIIIFESNIRNLLNPENSYTLVIASYFLLFIFIIVSTFYGFTDAKKIEQLQRRRQSFWVMLMFSFSVFFTVVYWLLTLLREASTFNYINENIDKFFEIASPIYSIKSKILGIVFIISLLASVFIAIKRYFTNTPVVNQNDKERNMFIDLIITIGSAFSEAMKKFFKIILITLEEIWYLIQDSIWRVFLIVIRISKVAAIIGVVYLIVVVIKINSQLISGLWSNTDIAIIEPLKLFQLVLIFICLPLCYSLFVFATYRNWFKYKFFKSLVNKNSYTTQRDRILLEQKSIYKTIFSSFVFLFLLPIFIGWTIINLFQPTNIGIVYIITFILVILYFIASFLYDRWSKKQRTSKR